MLGYGALRSRAERVGRCLDAVPRPDLRIDVRDVTRRRPRAQDEQIGDLAGAPPQRDEAQHLLLTFGQWVASLRRQRPMSLDCVFDFALQPAQPQVSRNAETRAQRLAGALAVA